MSKKLNKEETIKNILYTASIDKATKMDVDKFNDKAEKENSDEFIKNVAIYYNAKIVYEENL